MYPQKDKKKKEMASSASGSDYVLKNSFLTTRILA